MAVVAPMAKWVPLKKPTSTSPLTHNIICYHTMVGTLEGSYSWSNNIGQSYWHFGLGGDGELWQCQDLRYKSAANLEGNWRCIPIETEDTNAGIFPRPYANPLWTKAQITKLAQLTAWLCTRYNIPCRLVPNSRPEHRGIAYHKQGCRPNVVAGGENWSSSFGKTCPNRRIEQIPEVIRLAQQILGGTTPTPPKRIEDDDMVIIRHPNGSAMSLASGKLVQVTGEENVANAKAAGVPVFTVASDEWDRYKKAYGPVVT